MTALLEVQHLVKRYKNLTAVNDISFDLRAGQCLGLLGPNGAGKTTTVEMLEGITTPTAGTILYKGQPIDQRFRHEAGIMFQSTALQDFLTVGETLRLFQRFYSHTLTIDELVERCSLSELLGRDNRKLSGGQRQRLLLAIALVNDPDVIFLDEPTTGLDPQARRNFWDLVQDIKQRGKTIVLTTHYMEEAYVLCDDLVIMDHGRIIAEGSPDDLLARHFNDSILELPRTDLPADSTLTDVTLLDQGDTVEILTRDINTTIGELLGLGASLARLQIRARNLEDLFLELTGKELRA